jgi:twitching motility protein PilT
MQTLNDALYQLYVSREVTEDECLRVSSDANEFMRMIGRSPIDEEASDPPAKGRLAGAGGRR